MTLEAPAQRSSQTYGSLSSLSEQPNGNALRTHRTRSIVSMRTLAGSFGWGLSDTSTPSSPGYTSNGEANEQTTLIPSPDGLSDVHATNTSESIGLVSTSLPMTCTLFLEMGISLTTVLALGHSGTVPLAASSLASMTANISAFAVISGAVGALDTILPPALASDHPDQVGTWAQRMFVLLSLILPPMAVLWYNIEPILLYLKQDPEVAALASAYLRVLSLSLPAYAAFETARRYLQCQGQCTAPTKAVAVAASFNVALTYALVYGPECIQVGFLGAPIASIVSYYTMAFIAWWYCWDVSRQ